ncbi:hypothetical protein FHG87_003877, partial [Trinorchestia longiramus]
RKDLDLKQLSLPKKVPKELKDIDSKYQSLPKKKTKDPEGKYQSLPKRSYRDSEGRHLSVSRKSKDPDRHSSSKRSSSRDSDLRPSKRDNRSPTGHGKMASRRTSDSPRSPRWIPSESDDEDEVYSSIKSRDDSSHQSSIPEIPYSRPLPPLPAPSRYRRRTTEKDGPSPPLPPPRVSTLPGTAVGPPIEASSDPSTDKSRRIFPLDDISAPPIENNSYFPAKTDYAKDSGYHPPPPRIPHSKLSNAKMSELLVDKSSRSCSRNTQMMPPRESPQGGTYPQVCSTDQ